MQMDNAALDWDDALESLDVSGLPVLNLLRSVSEVFGPATAVLPQDDDDVMDLLAAIQGVDENPESPAAISYASSDDSHSVENSSFSGDDKKKKRVNRKRTTAGMSAQEKREQRKLRNRELAAESRKRKNDEMDRLRNENTILRSRIAELEKQLGVVPTGTKRNRVGTAVSTSIAVASLALFVVTGPAEAEGGSTASVLFTTLDSFDGQLLQFIKFVFTAFIAAFLFCVMAMGASRNASPYRLSSAASSYLPRRVNSLTMTNAV